MNITSMRTVLPQINSHTHTESLIVKHVSGHSLFMQRYQKSASMAGTVHGACSQESKPLHRLHILPRVLSPSRIPIHPINLLSPLHNPSTPFLCTSDIISSSLGGRHGRLHNTDSYQSDKTVPSTQLSSPRTTLTSSRCAT
jgi:hypothetical protein